MKPFVILVLSLALTTVTVRAGNPFHDTFGPRFKGAPPQFKPGPKKGLDAIHRWNQIAIDTSGFDHATALEQFGPGRASRAMAIVHIAIFDAMDAVAGGYESYTGVEAPH